MLEPGAILGNYRIEGVLGRGGMGVVYEATPLTGDRRLALKLLRPELSDDTAFAERLRHDVEALAGVKHPHVLPVHEVGRSAHGVFVVMRIVRGTSLQTLLRDRAVNAERALRILGQVAGALDAAHAVGVVHRDVKPSNVLVEVGSEHAYLSDFGQTLLGERTSAAIAEALKGTVDYLAPEVISGEEPTAASDGYAFAAMLFECLSGETVFPQVNDATVLYTHTHEPPPRISGRRLQLPTALDPVLETGLAKDPDDRWDETTAMIEAAREALGPERISSLGPPSPPRRANGAERARPAPVGSAARRQGPTALLVGAAALAGAALAIAVIGLADGQGRDDGGAVRRAGSPALLGSDLSAAGTPVDCRGREPSARSPACTIAGRVSVPERGAILRWSVRDARGELALQILRSRAGRVVQVARSQVETVPDGRPHTFRTNLAVRQGDRIALLVAPGAALGLRRGAGATQRWFPPLTARGRRDAGAGVDGEILLGVDFRAGRSRRIPRRLRGSAAANARDGSAVAPRRRLVFADGRIARVGLVEAGGRVAVDLFRLETRINRIVLPDLRAGGDLVALATTGGGSSFDLSVRWVNPGSGRVLEHRLRAYPRRLEYRG